MSENPLLQPITVGPYTLRNRMMMAPLTRTRADNEYDAPTALHREYYRQRASAGLVISEGSQISRQGQGYINTAGIYNEQQVAGWKKVLEAVHAEGGRMFAQLWHVGRVSHNYFHDGRPPVAPSPLRAEHSKVYTPRGYEQASKPRALEKAEIHDIINDFQQAALNALEAGFDGVQIHGANGYLIEQFLHDTSNKRRDEYGGSMQNRARFLFEVLEAVVLVAGADRVALRLSPSNLNNTRNDSQSGRLYEYVINQLSDFGLAFLELLEPLKPVDEHPQLVREVARYFRPFYNGTLVSNGNHDRSSGIRMLQEKTADMISYGRLFLANPDLPRRFKLDAPLNEPDPSTFYGKGPKGYTDYPFLDETVEKADADGDPASTKN